MAIPPMPANPFYYSDFWKALRRQALDRDKWRCVIDGCRNKAGRVDHIQTRPRHATGPTPLDRLDNLRCLCVEHDNQIKEDRNGNRRNGGVATIPGCDVDGWPLDPSRR